MNTCTACGGTSNVCLRPDDAILCEKCFLVKGNPKDIETYKRTILCGGCGIQLGNHPAGFFDCLFNLSILQRDLLAYAQKLDDRITVLEKAQVVN